MTKIPRLNNTKQTTIDSSSLRKELEDMSVHEVPIIAKQLQHKETFKLEFYDTKEAWVQYSLILIADLTLKTHVLSRY